MKNFIVRFGRFRLEEYWIFLLLQHLVLQMKALDRKYYSWYYIESWSLLEYYVWVKGSYSEKRKQVSRRTDNIS